MDGSDVKRSGALTPLVAILVVIGAVWFLKIAATVLIPLAFALFLVGVFWPVQRWLQRFMPRGLATVLTMLLLLAVCYAFATGIAYCARAVADAWPEYRERVGHMKEQASDLLEKVGLPGLDDVNVAKGEQRTAGMVKQASRVLSALGGFLMIVAFFVLGVYEVKSARAKLDGIGGRHAQRSRVVADLARNWQRYILVYSGLGLINAVLVYLFCLIIGLDLAFVWAFQAFLLNYIPSIGAVLAVGMPVLFAALQFESWTMALATLGGLGVIQLVMGVWVEPLVEGRFLSLSPIVILFSVTFWGWLWGIPGAFIAVPLTLVVLILCKQDPDTEWIARLLAEEKEPKK